MKQNGKQELVGYRISRAKETIREIEILIQNKLWNTAINRLYYACYYAVNALLAQHDINAQTHAGARQMFGLHFVKTELISKDLGKFYSEIFDKRLTGDYDDFIDYTEDDILDLYEPAKELIHSIDTLLKK
jgi:uncharacterized protein (UPF0332 family)